MKNTLAILGALMLATPGLAHHEEAATASSSLLHSPFGIIALAVLFTAAALVARRV